MANSQKEKQRRAFLDYLRTVYGGKGKVSMMKLQPSPEHDPFPTFKESGFNRELAQQVQQPGMMQQALGMLGRPQPQLQANPLDQLAQSQQSPEQTQRELLSRL